MPRSGPCVWISESQTPPLGSLSANEPDEAAASVRLVFCQWLVSAIAAASQC